MSERGRKMKEYKKKMKKGKRNYSRRTFGINLGDEMNREEGRKRGKEGIRYDRERKRRKGGN